MHVVFAANGRAGGKTARDLIERGEPVRVVAGRPDQGEPWKPRGWHVAVASLDDAGAVTAALTGATAAFLPKPPPLTGDTFGNGNEHWRRTTSLRFRGRAHWRETPECRLNVRWRYRCGPW